MLLWSPLLHHVCVSLAQPPTLTHQQPLASTSLACSDRTAPRLRPISAAAPRLRPLLADCIRCSPGPDNVLFSCFSSCYHAHSRKHSKYEGLHRVQSRPPNFPLPSHTHTHMHTHTHTHMHTHTHTHTHKHTHTHTHTHTHMHTHI